MEREVFYLTLVYLVMIGWWKLSGTNLPFEYVMGWSVIGGWIYLGIEKVFNI